MIGAAIIVLREVFEAALVVGIVLAATRGVARRGLWIGGGIVAGVAGAVVVAACAGRIASALEGVGQEVFNATVLLVATAMLGWHNLWMKAHGRELAQQMQSVGRRVASGETTLLALFLVVALAVLREGSEVVLFLYGIAAGGTGATALAAGSAIGLVGGLAIGVAVYYGLVAIPQRQLFAVTSVLLLVLAAGMAAQAAGFLVQAGVLPPLLEPLWDSSRWLPEHGVVGQVLHALVGYAERPSAMQVLFFAGVATGLALLMRRAGGRRGGRDAGAAGRRPAGAGVAAAVALVGCLGLERPARADLVVYSPVVEQGEIAVEVRASRDVDRTAERNGAEEHKLELEYAPNGWWLTEGLVTFERDPQGPRRASEVSWENIIALTPQGKYGVDLGVVLEYAHALRADGHDAIEAGLLAESTIGRTVVTVNLTGEQALTGGARAALAYSVRARWLTGPRFAPAIEAFGTFGEWGRFGTVRDNRHEIGPAAVGRFAFDGHQALKYEVAWVFGVTPGSPDSTGRLQLEYEF